MILTEQFYTILTTIGKAKIANAAALGQKVELAELALGDGGGAYYNPTEDQTTLRREVWRGAIGSVNIDPDNPNWINIQTVIPSQHGGFMIREAGVFDSAGDLIAVGKYPETYKPSAADGSVKDLVIRMVLEVSNTSSVVLKVDPTVILATQQQVEEAEARTRAYTEQKIGQVQQALAAHLAGKMSELKYIERDLSLTGEQLVVFSKEPKILFINGIVENTNKISIGRRSQDGETAEGIIEDSKKWTTSIVYSVFFYDTMNDSTYANVEINNNNVTLKWQKKGNGATGTARLTLVAIFH